MNERKIKLFIVDEKMNSVVVELDSWQFKQLGINVDNVRKNKTKTSLRQHMTEYLLHTENIDN